MHRNCIKYKDVWAAPGSNLHAALTEKKAELAAKLYKECQEREATLNKRYGVGNGSK